MLENITQLVRAGLLTMAYLSIYMLYGCSFMAIFRIDTKSFIKTIMTGFFVYYSLFQIVALPMKVLLMPLSTLSMAWIIINVLLLLIMYVKHSKLEIYKYRKYAIEVLKSNKKSYIIIIAVFLLQFVLIMLNSNYGSPADFSYYLGEITSSIQSNTICQYNSFSGLKLSQLTSAYLLENMGVHSAVICQFTGLHPLIEYNTCMRVVAIILSDLLLYKIALILFAYNHRKTTVMIVFATIINFCYVNLYSPSSFFFNRTAEGKTFAAVVILPMVFYIFLELLIEDESSGGWKILFITLFGAACINMTSLFVAPVLALCMVMAGVVVKRKYKWIINYAVCMIPAIITIIYYYLYSKGYCIVIIPK